MGAKFVDLMIEKRSIDYVPIAERHGKVWHLWPVWFSGDAHLATVATGVVGVALGGHLLWMALAVLFGDRKGTRLNSSHLGISYAVFCLKKKNNKRAIMLQLNLKKILTKSQLASAAN